MTIPVKETITRTAFWFGSFKHLSMLAVIPITAHAHWHLAVQLGIPKWLAPLLPVAIDSYVLASFRAWRDQANAGPKKVKTVDLVWALGLDAIAVAGSHAAGHFDLADPSMLGIRASLAAALGVLLVLTLWRVHALDVRITSQVRAGAKAPKRGPSADVPVTVPAPAADLEPVPVPEPRQAPTDPVGAPTVEPVAAAGMGSTLVDTSGPVSLDRWVALQVAAGASRGEALAVGARRFGVSQTTVKRRWLDAKAAAKAEAQGSSEPGDGTNGAPR